MATTTKALAIPVAETYAILRADNLADPGEALRENLGGEQLTERDFDILRVPAGGSTTWEVPTLSGTEDAKTIDGVIVLRMTPRAYFSRPMGEGEQGPPDCSSRDGITGIGDPGGDCKTCPLARFGSAPNGRAQACKANELLFTMRPDSLLPTVVRTPPGSLKGLRAYMVKKLSGAGIPYYGVVTRFSLEKDKNADGIVYSHIEFSAATDPSGAVQLLGPEAAQRMKLYGEQLRVALAGIEFTAEVVEPSYDATGEPIRSDAAEAAAWARANPVGGMAARDMIPPDPDGVLSGREVAAKA